MKFIWIILKSCIYYKTNYKHDHAPIMMSTVDDVWEVKLLSYIRFDVQSDDTQDIQLCAINVTYEDIFESFTNSSIEIYYIEYLENLKFDD